MKIDAPFLFSWNLLKDALTSPKALYNFVSYYQNLRSESYPQGKLPIVSILDLIPNAPGIPVTIQNIFQIPKFNVSPPEIKKHETAATTLVDSFYLALLARSISARKFLEVGTSFGETALLFALNSPEDAEITTLDIQKDNSTIGAKFRPFPCASKIRQKFAPLVEVAPQFESRSLDFIFIDGDHSYNGVMEDSNCAFNLIRTGGIICWHDYTFRFRHDCVRALDELHEKGREIVKIAYCNLSCYKEAQA